MLHHSLNFCIRLFRVQDIDYVTLLDSLNKRDLSKGEFVCCPINLSPHGFLFFTPDGAEDPLEMILVPYLLGMDIAVLQVLFPETTCLVFECGQLLVAGLDSVLALALVEFAWIMYTTPACRSKYIADVAGSAVKVLE